MQYMILLYGPEYPAPAPDEDGFAEYMAPWVAFNRKYGEAGVIDSGGELQPVATATTIRREYGGGDTIIDGPFAETKEVLGGYYVITVPDLDAALAVAADIPLPAGSFEVRPLAQNPQM